MPTVLKLRVSYHHGDAEQGRLELYEAGRSIQGLARAVHISTHALLNNGDVRSHGNRTQGAEVYIQPSQRGSFVELVNVVIDNAFVVGIGGSVVGNAFYDMLGYAWNNAVGRETQPQTPYVRNMAARRQELAEELAASLEAPLEEFHRPVKRQEEMQIQLARTRGQEIIRLDNNTRTYVSTRARGDTIPRVLGNVTRYNILSGFGRFYEDEIGETVPFNLDGELPAREVQLISWSLDQANRGQDGKVLFDVVPIVNARGETRRYLITAVNEVGVAAVDR
jgi:hypothetical protein